MRRLIIAVILLAFAVLSIPAQTAYRSEVKEWRSEHEKELAGENSWFSLAGLFWLKEGVNTIGRGSRFDIQLTENFDGTKFGTIDFHNGTATLRIEPGVTAEVDGQRISEFQLVSDAIQKQSVVKSGSQNFYLIKREERYGIRLKDNNNRARLDFKRLNWFPIDAAFRVIARFEPFPEPIEIPIPNMLGGSYKMMSEGVLKFRLKGKNFSLQPVEEDGRFFIVFRDLTSRTQTYGVGRFLYAEKSKDNRVILDFNKAENPPCAYTTFATCPIPPRKNRLSVAIPAGERRYRK